MAINNLVKKVSFIGGGNMAGAIVGGLLNRNFPPANISISEPYEPRRTELKELYKGVNITEENHSSIRGAEAIVIAVKPTVVKKVLTAESFVKELTSSPVSPLFISIAAGVQVSTFKKTFPKGMPTPSLIRCMPNTPSLVGLGAIGLYATKDTPEPHRALAETIMGSVAAPKGGLVWVPEETDLDAVTAISGSGPAYYFYLVELIEKEGIKMGLDKITARKLATFTALGASKMVQEQCLGDNSVDPSELRRRVTSPNGTTHAAIQSFQQNDLEGLVAKALKACYDRSKEIGNNLEQE